MPLGARACPSFSLSAPLIFSYTADCFSLPVSLLFFFPVNVSGGLTSSLRWSDTCVVRQVSEGEAQTWTGSENTQKDIRRCSVSNSSGFSGHVIDWKLILCHTNHSGGCSINTDTLLTGFLFLELVENKTIVNFVCCNIL